MAQNKTQEIFEAIEAYFEAHMKATRLGHTRRVTDMAIQLAERFNVPVERARLAAMLHDIAKHYDRQMVAEALERHNIEDPLLYAVPFLAHGEIAAEVSREVFGIEDEDILNAVRYHTYGRRGMSPLEKIVFLADYIEEGRQFDGVETARAKALVDLNDAVLCAVGQTIAYLIKCNAVIHPYSLDLYNELISEQQHKELPHAR